MLHRTVQLFPLVGPLHRRGAHIVAHRHQRVHESPSQLLVLEQSAKLIARHVLVWIHPRTHPPQGILLHDTALPTDLVQKHRVRDGPDQTMPAQTVHAGTIPEPEQMLRPDTCSRRTKR